MSDNRDYILFLNSDYSDSDLDYYRELIDSKITVAVDGGIRFFLQNDIKPNLLIGDFDSLPEFDEDYLTDIEVIKHPVQKDKTDGQLALETAIERGGERIEICGAFGESEVDHVLGNILLLDLVNKHNNRTGAKVKAKITGPETEVYLVSNGKLFIKGQAGDTLSIVPLAKKIWVDFDGMEYESPDRWIKMGETLSLRNKLVKDKVGIVVKGKAVIVLLRGKQS